MSEVNVYKWEPTGLHKVNGDKFGTATGSTVVLEADYDTLLAERDLLLANVAGVVKLADRVKCGHRACKELAKAIKRLTEPEETADAGS